MKFEYLRTSKGKQQRISMSPMTPPKVKLVLRFCRIISTLIYKYVLAWRMQIIFKKLKLPIHMHESDCSETTSVVHFQIPGLA